MTDDKMDVSITVEADSVSNRVFTQVQNLLREGQSEPFEKANLGWVLFGITRVAESSRQKGGNINNIHSKLAEENGIPYDGVEVEKDDVKNAIETLEEKGLVVNYQKDKYKIVGNT